MIVHHGYAEHLHRYQHLIDLVNELGFHAFGFDQRGHGHTTTPPTALVEDFDRHVQDSLEFRVFLREKYPDLPVILFGHSMGGLLAVRSAEANPRGVDGVILSSPALLIGTDTPPFVKTLSTVLSQITPNLQVVPLDSAKISRRTEMVAAYDSDPLVYHGKVKARTGAEMLRASANVWYGTAQWNLPTLIFHGTQDGLADIDGSRRFYAEIRSQDKTFQEFDGGFHELLNDTIADEVFALIHQWLNARFASK
ncbi:hydrolase [Deinococcus roseus]|uniref:Hydrolase n=1 Tax=Deinococcus roseus TaxID=392414 RepID=A0ABQ2CTA5_9DEIO|nr:hydrolase [Deinococcus roseus]